ncbi:MAG: hypothetical protein KC656_08555 [Myxococcales bacterium]|nr:hypothetical protein [Myxococcales bacterium]
MVVPRPLRLAAILQITSGLLNILLVSWVAWLGISCFCGVVTFPFLSAGGVCGLFSFLLVPIGMLEFGAGVYGWLDPREGVSAMRLVAWAEIAGILVGGLPSAIVGLVVRALLGRDEVLVWLEG